MAYEYVDDGAFAEPWLDTRLWTSAEIWGSDIQSRLGAKSLHAKKSTDRGRPRDIYHLTGLSICTETETMSFPMGKLTRAHEFLSMSCFDPGVARIEIRTLEELRVNADRWSLRNTSLSPEMHAIDRLMSPYLGPVRSHGVARELQQGVF